MKKCPFCAEEIQDEAIKCKHCGEFLKNIKKWYYESWGMIFLFIAIGPFALWFVWKNPDLAHQKKVIITVVVCVLTYFIGEVVADSFKNILNYYDLLFNRI